MKKIYLFGHAGSSNHGCEAIVRSTIELLHAWNREYKTILCSKEKGEDEKYLLNKKTDIIQDQLCLKRNSIDYIKLSYKTKIKKEKDVDISLKYKKLMKNMDSSDIYMSIGGDNYCYDWWGQFALMHNEARKKTDKTVLWSCSINPESVTDKMKRDLEKYSLITARESISYNVLKKINKNTWLIPDVAFRLKYNNPNSLKKKEKTVGINLSPLVLKYESKQGMVMKNYYKLIEFILEKTNMNILLVPHVVAYQNDDREVLNILFEKYKKTKRISLQEDADCCILKNVISQCDFFIGARTHATIAAYSTGIPTLVTGYSNKSIGIATDLFGNWKNYVVDIRKAESENELKNAFKFILKNENQIKIQLLNVMSDYKKKIDQINIALDQLTGDYDDKR